MGFYESCNGRKRAYQEEVQESDDGCKRICSSEYNKEGVDVSIEYVAESDDVFVCNGVEGSAFSCSSNGEKLIVNGDLGSAQVDDYTKDCGHVYGTTLVHKESGEVGKSDVGLSSSYEEENPLEGLDWFFDDVALDFGVHDDDEGCSREFLHVVQDTDAVIQGFGGEQVYEGVEKAGANGGNTEQAFIGENEVHDWLFSSEQTDPPPPPPPASMAYCNGDVLEPSLAQLLEGMARI